MTQKLPHPGIRWDPKQIPTDERARYIAEFQFDPVTELVFIPPSFMEYHRSLEWTGEGELAKQGIQFECKVYFEGNGYLAVGMTFWLEDQSYFIPLDSITIWRKSVLDSAVYDAQNPPWRAFIPLFASLEQNKAPWEVFGHFLVVARKIATEGLRSLNPGLAPAGLHAALVRTITLALHGLVPEVVTLSPRGIAVGGALVHPFLVPSPKPPGQEWFRTQNRTLTALEEELRDATTPRSQTGREIVRVLATARDALLREDIASAWAWVVISRARQLQIQAGPVGSALSFDTYHAAWIFIQRQHLAEYMFTARIEEAARAEEMNGIPEMPDLQGSLGPFLRVWRETRDTWGTEPDWVREEFPNAAPPGEAGFEVLRELVKAFEFARMMALDRWMTAMPNELMALETKCRVPLSVKETVAFSDQEMEIFDQLFEVVQDHVDGGAHLVEAVMQAMQKKLWVATARAALHAIQLAPRLAEAWVQLARVVGGLEDTHISRLMGRVRGCRHVQVTTVLGAGDQQPAQARACLENAVYLDVTCAEAWAALARIPILHGGVETLRLALEILPASPYLLRELRAMEGGENAERIKQVSETPRYRSPPKFVLASLRVVPEDVDIDLEKLLQEIRERLPSRCEVIWSSTIPFVFGLSALKLQVKIPVALDRGIKLVESAIATIPHIQGVETEMMSHF